MARNGVATAVTVSFVSLGLLLSGCITQEEAGPSAETVEAQPAPTDRFEWTSYIAGAAAFRLTFRFTAETHCEREYAAMSGPHPTGPHFIAYRLGPDGEVTGASGSGGGGMVLQVAGTAIVADESGGGGTRSGGAGNFAAGDNSFVFTGANFEPRDHEWTGGGSFRISLACDDPVIAGVEVAGSREALLVAPVTPGGGTVIGPALPFAPDVALDNEYGAEFGSPEVEAFLWPGGVGKGELTTPDGTESFTMTGGRPTRTVGGPGAWGVRFDAVVDDGFSSMAMLGLAPLPDLDAIEEL